MSRLAHGGALDAAIADYGGTRTDWLDLSTGINPAPWPVPQVPEEAWARLPDSAALSQLLDAASARFGVRHDMSVVAAPGTQALIQALPRLLPGSTAAVLQPDTGTYGEHANCCKLAGRSLQLVEGPEGIADNESLVSLVHPNNPDGIYWDPPSVIAMAERIGANGGHVVVDEAFCDLLPEASFAAGMPANMIVLRSFGKFFGLAGLRLGFAIANTEICRKLEAFFGPWPVSGPALAIGAMALADDNWIEETRNRLAEQSHQLADMLEAAGLPVIGRHPLFVLVRHARAAEIAETLARKHILVRSFEDRPDLIRFGLPRGSEPRKVLGAALDEVMAAV